MKKKEAARITVEEKTGAALKTAIAPLVVKIEQVMRDDLSEATREMDELLEEVVRYGLFNGGKRIRPLLTLLCYRLCGGEQEAGPDIHRLALAFEYLHCATLFHDDVIDQATMRRGRPAVNIAYGQTAAILAGDFLHARSMLLVGREGGAAALEVFCEATAAMVDGEFLQLRNAGNSALNEEAYYAVIMGKTARLIGAACEIGALAGGAGQQGRQALRHYGLHLGCAFQIIDDLLDYLGNPAITGKEVGNDFCEGKLTLPLIMALNHMKGNDRQHVLSLLNGVVEERRQGVALVTAWIASHEGFTLAREKAEAMIATALSELESLASPANQTEVAILRLLAHFVLQRDK